MRAVVLLLLLASCKGRVERARDAIAAGQSLSDLPACAASDCFEAIANALGSKSGYHEDPPDQASAAAVAVVVARDGKGSLAGHPDTWIRVERSNKGPGPDALRAAVGRRLEDLVKAHGHKVESEEEARKLLGAVSALPGACGTYASLAFTKSDEDLPLTEQADHSPCVQRDLSRASGPGGTYGFGFWRAVAGALAFAKEHASALEEGRKLSAIATPAPNLDSIEPKRVETPDGNRWSEHASSPPSLRDAGRD